MPGAQLNNKPVSAKHFLDCNEESQLELHLQRQLEEDVARIFDESIYSDLEVVCGKLKILTHSCILKARTDQFYRKLHKILHVNIDRNTFDEIYSFISDVYTECNIQHEEKEIIAYLERNWSIKQLTKIEPTREKEPEVFPTSKCITPYVDETQKVKANNSSPSTELTKEYYALVPIEGNLLEKELIEQDELSNAFNSIIKSQALNTTEEKISQRNKPTSLPLNSSHTSKTVQLTSICDVLNKTCIKEVSSGHKKNVNIVANKHPKSNELTLLLSDTTKSHNNIDKNINNTNFGTEKSLDPPYSPDSLITDDPSSSSDYLSAVYTCSPGVISSCPLLGIYCENDNYMMENIYTISDSGLEDTAHLGSINSHMDVTLTTVSLSDSTSSAKNINGQNTITETCGKSLKEEKQRQNEEIVILESSSLSSETGSWESVYPPKLIEKEICEKFLYTERQQYFEQNHQNNSPDDIIPSLMKSSPYKSAPCFIDASSLADEEDTPIVVESKANVEPDILPAPSRPMPCSTVKVDISPVDWSESNDNEDSLEQAEKRDSDFIPKDLSPTIFEMTPITEDSLCTNEFENASNLNPTIELDDSVNNYRISKKENSQQGTAVIMACTPNNSIISLKTYEPVDKTSKTAVNADIFSNRERKGSKSPPIVSGGVSVEDHLPQAGSSQECSLLPRYPLENTPIVTGAYVPQRIESQEKPRTNSASAWVVDMSRDLKSDDVNISSKSPGESVIEKKNMFSMYIDLSEKTTLKDMPARLSSSINTKKNFVSNEKSTSRNSKVTTELDTSVFEKYESLCNDPNISISEIIAIPEKHNPIPEILETSSPEVTPTVNQMQAHKCDDKVKGKERPHPNKSLSDSQDKDLFVKLSDLDKPVQKADVLISIEPKEVDVRMTRSIPDWGEAFSNNSRSIEVITSFHSENALSLNRLFPHLKNEFSRSMPGSLSSRTRSPLRLGTSSTLGDAEEQVSEMSEMSSMQSSICRSGFGNSTTDSQTSSLIDNCSSRLGQDLLRMFLEEIATDVIVEVSGKRFKAHKCILSSRCQFFAAILSGGWVERLGNVIVLPPFSYNVVYFVLCHIYSGLATIPDSLSLLELATVTDMLGLEGLKEAIMFTLKAKYCHHFHKPCPVCIVGVLECLPLCFAYGLDDLYHKCLNWITKHFSKIWPTKAFATLPPDLLDKCYQHHIVNLTIDNVIITVYGCGITTASLQNSRWSDSVARMCRRLITAAAHFIASKLVAVMKAIPPLPNEAPEAAKQALDDCLAAAIEWARPEVVISAYGFLSTIIKEKRNHNYTKPDLISNGTERSNGAPNNLLYMYAGSWRLQCEGALVRASPRVVTTQAFKDLPSELRKRLRELGCIKYGAHALPPSPPTTHQDRKSKSNTPAKHSKASSTTTVRSVDIAQVRASFVPYAPKPKNPLTSTETLKSNSDLRDIKKPLVATHPPKVRTTKAQEERAKFNKFKSTKSQERLNCKASVARPPSFEKTKPRYLEPKIKDKKLVVNKHLPKIDSSSESSRNSSPVHSRNFRASPHKGGRGEMGLQTMSQDSLATSSRPRTAEPSTDSLSESQTSNKYATYTKAKHTKVAVEPNRAQKHQEPVQHTTRLNSKTKTKIPVYSNQTSKSKAVENRNSRDQKWGRVAAPKTTTQNNPKPNERKMPGSLMNATKSSSAKIVPRIVRESPNSKVNTPKNQRSGECSRHQHTQGDKESSSVADIPVMERSGTFLKDEPTFGNNTAIVEIE